LTLANVDPGKATSRLIEALQANTHKQSCVRSMMSLMRNPSCEQATGAPGPAGEEVNIEEEEAEDDSEDGIMLL
jgi:hypothetical protein